MARVLVRDDHEGHHAAGWHMVEEYLEGFQATGGGTDADDGKTWRFGRNGSGRE